jgi:DNA modification methylase
MEYNKIHNMDCIEWMQSAPNVVDLVLTSPPYNTSRVCATDKYNSRYDSFQDFKSDADYIDWTIQVFNGYDNVLKQNGCVLYNLSYSSENTSLIWLVIAAIIQKTNFTTADCIVCKKKSAIPNNRSRNKLTRICEYVFVFCRKTEIDTFFCNKKVVSTIEKTGQENFENLYNFIEASNNDGSNDLNKATFSTDFARTLLMMYGQSGIVVYDSFMGTGTTADAAIIEKMHYIGTELSESQCKDAENRILRRISKPTLF